MLITHHRSHNTHTHTTYALASSDNCRFRHSVKSILKTSSGHWTAIFISLSIWQQAAVFEVEREKNCVEFD